LVSKCVIDTLPSHPLELLKAKILLSVLSGQAKISPVRVHLQAGDVIWLAEETLKNAAVGSRFQAGDELVNRQSHQGQDPHGPS
jgi:hypothetical protein